MSDNENSVLVNRAWTLAGEVYSGGDPARFMENPQPASLGLGDTPDRLMSPAALIERDGQAGFDKVESYLKSREKVPEPA